MRRENGGSSLIIRTLLFVNSAVYFYSKLCGRTIEVENERSNGVLPPESHAELYVA